METKLALKEFTFECKIRKLSERTIRTYHNHVLNVLVYLEKEFSISEVEEIDYRMIQNYLSYLTNNDRKESYINSIIKSLRCYFNYCKNEEYLIKNPMKKITFQKSPIRLINTFNDREVYSMINYYKGKTFLSTRNNLIMTLLLDSGIRNLELCELKYDNIHDSHIKIIGKGNKERHVPLTPSIYKAFIRYDKVREKYIKPNYDSEYLFMSNNGRLLSVVTVERVVAECGKACKVRSDIRISPHTCRHYYAQAQLKNGCDLFSLSRILGHNKLDITRRYLQSLQDDESVKLCAKTTPLSNL